MGKMVREGYSRLDVLLAEHGEDSFLQGICGRVAEGDSPDVVSRSMGLPWLVLRKWLEGDDKRVGMLELAKRCWADRLVWDAVSAANGATVEDVSVSKLQADTYLKVAAKADRKAWGDGVGVGGGGFGGVTIVIGTATPHPDAVLGEVIGEVIGSRTED